ncbi:sensor histidine kinase [Streptococcus suis]|uniref:histidine kinase n=1 Tax=Streptococcus suis TaxID=1307 RepID=A0A4T2GLS5_STRSU|nr:sensor histidine kinase [Streptococcus suis]MBM7270283.1 sensor histidine kinase [Streptococcus suis]TIH98860.1 HAMP domain-containing histidine kinase [Streptococcus suis]
MRHSFLTGWLRSRWQFFACFLVFLLFILFLSDLFSVQRQLTYYATGLLFLFAVIILGMDGLVEWRRYRKKIENRDFAAVSALETMLMDDISSLEDKLNHLQAQQAKWQGDMEDYYTMWAHQMKIPLAASHLLVGELQQHPSQAALEKELFKLEHYTSLVLNYLRLQSFHEDLQLEQVDLEEVVRDLVKKYSLFFIEDKIKLDLGQLSLTLSTDKRWLSLLIEQFLSNAVKYSKGKQVAIGLEGEVLVITDTGIGIAESDLQRVFERGFSGYNGRRTQQSSGLGLYLAKRLAEKLGYKIELHSDLGQGTVVKIHLEQADLVFK